MSVCRRRLAGGWANNWSEAVVAVESCVWRRFIACIIACGTLKGSLGPKSGIDGVDSTRD